MESSFSRAFERGCPYYQESSIGLTRATRPSMFRLKERFSDHSEYVGDSLGGRTYIDRSAPRPCSGSCLCWDLDKRVDSEFVFIVSKTETSIEVHINSNILSSYLAGLLGRSSQELVCQVFDGFVLLKNLDSLRNHLHDLRTEMQDSSPEEPLTSLIFEQDSQLETELSLLLEGFVEDCQVFSSFGYEKLYEEGYLSYDRWKAFQCSSSQLNIDRLDKAFHAISDEGRSPRYISIAAQSWSATTVKLLLEDGYNPNAFDPFLSSLISVPLVEAIKYDNQEVIDLLIDHEANVDGLYPNTRHSPLIAALENGNTSAITKLLRYRVDLGILGSGEITVADRWRFATTLLEHGISADSVLKVLPESVDKKLLGTLFHAGGDVMDFSSYKPLSQNARFPGRVTASGGHLDDAQGVDPDSHQVRCWRLEFSEATEVSHGLASLTASASHADESLEAGVDSHQTEELRRTYNQTRALVRAIRIKDQGSVELYIQNGANPTLGLTAALQNHDSMTLRLLLDAGADLNYVAAAKVELSLMAAVTAGDRGFVKSLLKACATSTLLKDLDFVLDGQTPLMVAVMHNDAYIAQVLMDLGASPTFLADGHSCFAIARKNGLDDMLQLLLRGTRISPLRANLFTVRSSLQIQSARENGTDNIVQIPPTSPRVHPFSLDQYLMYPYSLDPYPLDPLVYRDFLEWEHDIARKDQKKLAEHYSREIRLRLLWLEFRNEHSHITACALASPQAWGYGFDTDYSKAWNSGTAVMRSLCAGKLPRSLNETIMFLAVAKAICLSDSACALPAWHSHFASDLARWQTLFNETDGSLSAFQQAVSSIWDIHLDKADHVGNPDPETLTHFHELAVSLADGADLSLNLREHDQGLLASQSRWRSCENLTFNEEDQYALTRQESWAFLGQMKESRDLETSPTLIFPKYCRKKDKEPTCR